MLDDVRNYYGNILKTSADLQTNACCTGARFAIREILNLLAPEVVQRYSVVWWCLRLLDGLRARMAPGAMSICCRAWSVNTDSVVGAT